VVERSDETVKVPVNSLVRPVASPDALKIIVARGLRGNDQRGVGVDVGNVKLLTNAKACSRKANLCPISR
jgi:hypothetical protein